MTKKVAARVGESNVARRGSVWRGVVVVCVGGAAV